MSEEPTLVIMAAGFGSRFEGGIKQLTELGPNGETIMDYSIQYAKKAGFKEIVLVIRKDIEELVNKTVKAKWQGLVSIQYAYQELNDLPGDYRFPERTKPWGTTHAVLAVRDIVTTPFLVINADDYYGEETFKLGYQFLKDSTAPICNISFKLKNTLSKIGGVNRGLIEIDDTGKLIKIEENNDVKKVGDIVTSKQHSYIDPNSQVSMNVWGFTPAIFSIFEQKMLEFLSTLDSDDNKKEILIPDTIGELIKNDTNFSVLVVSTSASWFGLTYKEDVETAKEKIKQMEKN